ncbi:MAG: carbohydrate porin [Candidatus Omnitrophota bacterium]
MFKMGFKKIALTAIVFLFLAGNNSFAEDNPIRNEIDKLKTRIQILEERLNKQDKCMEDQQRCILEQDKKIAEYESKLSEFGTALHRQEGVPIPIAEGLEIGVGATMVVQGTNNTNDATSGVTKKESRTDASYSTDITIGKEFEETGGKAFLHLEAGKGAGLEDNLTLYSDVNRDASDSENVQVTELWYEQVLLNDKAAAVFGKIDPTIYFDNNEIANDETTQFLGRIFRNSPVVEFPDNTAGIRIAYIPDGCIELGYGILDADGDWEKIGDNLFNIAQVTFKANLFNQPGNYRLYGWNNSAAHTKWHDSSAQKEDSYGFGLSFDQKANDIATLFCRYGWQNPKVYNPNTKAAADSFEYSLEQSWSAGLQLEGKSWGREKDVLGFAAGQVYPSNDYKKIGTSSVASPRAAAEGHLETYYRIYVNNHLSVSPDVQYIWNPFGKDVEDDTSSIFIGGMRAQIDF